jgi:hypothetical protein
MLDGRGRNDGNAGRSERLPRMDGYVFAGQVTIAFTLFAMGIMDVLAVMTTALSTIV